MEEQKTSIPTFYRDRSIFITGATGLLGKVLVEKLLRSCSDIKTIFLLLRPKKGIDAKQRLEAFLKAKLFDGVKCKEPSAISKLVIIEGDLTCAGLGISESDINLLVDNVSVVFHSAASVSFNEPLKKAVDLNILGTRRLLELCRKMKKLEALIHVSTVYCNCERTTVEEVVYDSVVPPQKLIDTIEWMDEDLIEALTPGLIRDKPNTYLYTKALTESLLVEENSDLPIAIVRPSAVTATWKEPFPGWIDNYNGSTGLIVSAGKGLLRVLHAKSSSEADLIPVDVVINLMIAVAWYTATHRPEKMKVYNCTSGSLNKITWRSMVREVTSLALLYPSGEIFRYPHLSIASSKVQNYLYILLYHLIPAYVFDLVLVLRGRKPKLVLLYGKLHRSMQDVQYFLTHELKFSCDNVIMLGDTLSTEDRKEFNFNIKSLRWKHYLEDYVLGIRQYLLREEEQSLPSARSNLSRILMYTQLAHVTIFIMLCIIVFMLYYSL